MSDKPRRLTRNASQCRRCEVVIESTYRHDFKSCKCGDIFVDGGLVYRRIGWKDDAQWDDLSEYAEEVSVG